MFTLVPPVINRAAFSLSVFPPPLCVYTAERQKSKEAKRKWAKGKKKRKNRQHRVLPVFAPLRRAEDLSSKRGRRHCRSPSKRFAASTVREQWRPASPVLMTYFCPNCFSSVKMSSTVQTQMEPREPRNVQMSRGARATSTVVLRKSVSKQWQAWYHTTVGCVLNRPLGYLLCCFVAACYQVCMLNPVGV